MNMIARITEYCVRKDIISSSDAEWFSYGLVQRSEKLIAICFLFPLGCLLSSFSTSLVFYLSFFLLRTHTNGYHAKTSAGCLLFSICSECVLFLLILPYLKGSASLWILTLSTIIIFWLAPYDHPNLHMTKEELAASRRMARLTVLILDMALILSLGAKFYAFANGIALGLGFTAFLLIVAHGKQKYEKGDMYGTDLKHVAPTIVTANASKVEPSSAQRVDLSTPKAYRVYASNGAYVTYTVTAYTEEPSPTQSLWEKLQNQINSNPNWWELAEYQKKTGYYK